MKYEWEVDDVKYGGTAHSAVTCWAFGFYNRASCGGDNGWYAVSSGGAVNFFQDVPALLSWMNNNRLRPSK